MMAYPTTCKDCGKVDFDPTGKVPDSDLCDCDHNAAAQREFADADGCDLCRCNPCACDENKFDGEMR